MKSLYILPNGREVDLSKNEFLSLNMTAKSSGWSNVWVGVKQPGEPEVRLDFQDRESAESYYNILENDRAVSGWVRTASNG